MNYYDLLGIEKDATMLQIKNAYRKIAKQKHPDKLKTNQSEQFFKEINEAYDVLYNQAKRQKYDMDLNTIFIPSGFNWQSFVQSFQSGNIFQAQLKSKKSVSDSKHFRQQIVNVELTLNQLYLGCTKQIPVIIDIICDNCKDKQNEEKVITCPLCNGKGNIFNEYNDMQSQISYKYVCNKCGGKGTINFIQCQKCNGQKFIQKDDIISLIIPKGILKETTAVIYEDKFNLVLAKILVKDNNDYQLQPGQINIKKVIDITAIQAITGTKISLQYLDNSVIDVDINQGTISGTQFVIQGKGLSFINDPNKIGNLIVTINVVIPKLSSLNKISQWFIKRLVKNINKRVKL